jgi:hypothetical protein
MVYGPGEDISFGFPVGLSLKTLGNVWFNRVSKAMTDVSAPLRTNVSPKWMGVLR